MSESDFHEEEWIAKYRAAMEAFAAQQKNSSSIRNFMIHLQRYFRRTLTPSVARLKPVVIERRSNASTRDLQARKNGTFS